MERRQKRVEREERRRVRAARIERLEAEVERCRLELVYPLDSYRQHRDEAVLVELLGTARQRLQQLRSEQEDDQEKILGRLLWGAGALLLIRILAEILG